MSFLSGIVFIYFFRETMFLYLYLFMKSEKKKSQAYLSHAAINKVATFINRNSGVLVAKRT